MRAPTAVLLPLLASLLAFHDAEGQGMEPPGSTGMPGSGTTGMPGSGGWDYPDQSGIPESVILITGLNFDAIRTTPGKMDQLSYYAAALISSELMVGYANVRVVAIYPQVVAPGSMLPPDTIIKFDAHFTEPAGMDFNMATAQIPHSLVLEIEGGGEFAFATSSGGLSAAMYPSTSPWTMTYDAHVIDLVVTMSAINSTWSEVMDANSQFYATVRTEVENHFSLLPGQVTFFHMANDMYRLRLNFTQTFRTDSEIQAFAEGAVSDLGEGEIFREDLLHAVLQMPSFQQEHGAIPELCIDYMALTSHYIGGASNGVETCVSGHTMTMEATTMPRVVTEPTAMPPMSTEQSTMFRMSTEQTTMPPMSTEQTTMYRMSTEETTRFPMSTEETTRFPMTTEETTKEWSSSPPMPPSSSSGTTSLSSSRRRGSTSRTTTMSTSPSTTRRMPTTSRTRMATTSRTRMASTSRTRVATTSRTRMATTAHERTTRRPAVHLNSPGLDDEVYEREAHGGSADRDEERVRYPSGAGHHRESARQTMWTKRTRASRKVFVINAPTSLRDGLITMDNCPYWKRLLGLEGECAQGRLAQPRDDRRLSEIVV